MPVPQQVALIPQAASMDSNMLMSLMLSNPMAMAMNPMASMNPMETMMMNPMASMMNPMASMHGMGMMNPMAQMVNPVQMAFSMCMKLAQQNGNATTVSNQNGNNGVNVEGALPLNPNNRIL